VAYKNKDKQLSQLKTVNVRSKEMVFARNRTHIGGAKKGRSQEGRKKQRGVPRNGTDLGPESRNPTLKSYEKLGAEA